MAMTKKLWSISGLATELQIDRRTIARRLQDVPPRGKIAGGHDGWHLADALAVSPPRGRSTAPAAPATPRPEGFSHLRRYDEADPITGAIAAGLTLACLAAPRLFAVAAIEMGAPAKVAFAGANLFLALMVTKADGVLSKLVPGAEFEIDGTQVEEIDRAALAGTVGEKVDLPKWEAHQAAMAARLNSDGI